MKEEVCETILKTEEQSKWWRIIHQELEESEWESLKNTIEKVDGKTKNELGLKMGDGLIKLYRYKTKWGGEFNKILAEIHYDTKEIKVHDEIVYDFCKMFGKEYKFKKLIKCWWGCIQRS